MSFQSIWAIIPLKYVSKYRYESQLTNILTMSVEK